MITRLKSQPYQMFFLALIVADLMYFVLHILYTLPDEILPFFSDSVFAIDTDRGLAESFQYVQELWVALLFFWLVFKYRRYALIGFGLLFAYFLFDDMLTIHEILGGKLSVLFGSLPIAASLPNLRAKDFGELFFDAMLGGSFFVILAWSYWRGDKSTRKIFHEVFALLACFATVAVAFDFIDRLFSQKYILVFMKLFEDGGEMLVMSTIVWYGRLLCDSKGSQPVLLSANKPAVPAK